MTWDGDAAGCNLHALPTGYFLEMILGFSSRPAMASLTMTSVGFLKAVMSGVTSTDYHILFMLPYAGPKYVSLSWPTLPEKPVGPFRQETN